MKVFALTTELTVQNGWGRYSLDMAEALSHAGVAVSVAMRRGTPVHPFVAARILPDADAYWANFFLAPYYAWRLRRAAQDCDVIHSFVEPYAAIAYWLARFTGKGYFVTTHGTYGLLPYHLSTLKRRIHHRAFSRARRIVCVSNYTKRQLEQHGLTNLSVINNGITAAHFYHEPTPQWSERDELLLSVGALKHRKGQHVALQAFASVAADFPSFRYCLVGEQSDPKYVARLQQLAVKLGVAERVEFRSGISDADLLALYRRAKLLLLPSISKGVNIEGFGLVYLEANACGVPAIGSLDSGAEDAIREGDTGYLVPQEDAAAAAERIRTLLGDAALWQRMSDHATVWAKDHDWKEVITAYTELYAL